MQASSSDQSAEASSPVSNQHGYYVLNVKGTTLIYLQTKVRDTDHSQPQPHKEASKKDTDRTENSNLSSKQMKKVTEPEIH